MSGTQSCLQDWPRVCVLGVGGEEWMWWRGENILEVDASGGHGILKKMMPQSSLVPMLV